MNAIASKFLQPFTPCIHSARGYTLGKLRRDFVAGLTVSVVELPQAMAYALIAGVPPQYGIYSSIIQGILGALLSSSEHVTTGPTNTQALLIASAAMPLVDPHIHPATYLQLVFILTFMKGLIQLSLWGLKSGELVQFISRSVLVGVSAGAGVLIIFGQAGPFFGMRTTGVSALPGVLGQATRIYHHLGEANWRAALIASGVVACSVVSRAINKFIPGPLIGVILAGAVVALMGWKNIVPTIGQLPHTLPHFEIPGHGLSFSTIRALLPGALALALLGGIESVAIAKTIANKSGEKIVANQEFFAQGFKNTLTSFIQCIPGSASFTRSMLDYEAGAETRYAAVMNAILVGIMFVAFTSVAQFIPMAALSGVLMVIAVRLIDVSFFRRIARAQRSDAAVLVITTLAVMFSRLEYAIFIGIIANILFFLKSSSKLYIAHMEQTASGTFAEKKLYDSSGEERIAFLQVEGELYFAIADQLQDELNDARAGGVRAVVLRLKRCHNIDGTVLDVLEKFAQEMKDHGGQLLLCGIRPNVLRIMRDYGLLKLLGEDNVFPAERGAFVGARQAIERAKVIIGGSVDTTEFELATDFAYDI